MKFSYDPRYNIAYICLQEKPAQVESVRLSEELVVDMAPDGTIYGIDLLNANEQLRKSCSIDNTPDPKILGGYYGTEKRRRRPIGWADAGHQQHPARHRGDV